MLLSKKARSALLIVFATCAALVVYFHKAPGKIHAIEENQYMGRQKAEQSPEEPNLSEALYMEPKYKPPTRNIKPAGTTPIIKAVSSTIDAVKNYSVEYPRSTPPPWINGNCFSLAGKRVVNMHAENFNKIIEKLAIKNVHVEIVGNMCVIVDPRISIEWMLDKPCWCCSGVRKEILEPYLDCFRTPDLKSETEINNLKLEVPVDIGITTLVGFLYSDDPNIPVFTTEGEINPALKQPPFPRTTGNCFNLVWEGRNVTNMCTENFEEICKRLDLKTVQIELIGTEACRIIDPRIPKEWKQKQACNHPALPVAPPELIDLY